MVSTFVCAGIIDDLSIISFLRFVLLQSLSCLLTFEPDDTASLAGIFVIVPVLRTCVGVETIDNVRLISFLRFELLDSMLTNI